MALIYYVLGVLALCLVLSGCSAVPGDAAFRAGQYAAALRLYEKEYNQGNLDAGLRLAELYAEGLGTRVDHVTAVKIYLDLATRGVVAAEHNLGVSYEYGEGVAQDYEQAAQWYKKAADRNYLWSIYNLGTLHANRHLRASDDVVALALLLKAQRLAKERREETAEVIRSDRLGHVERLRKRMTPEQIASAEADQPTKTGQTARNVVPRSNTSPSTSSGSKDSTRPESPKK